MATKTNLEPVLLFKAGDKGVYYRPQYGVIMDGIITDGSVRIVARHIHQQHIDKYEPGRIDPGSLTEEDILNEVTRFILEDDAWVAATEEPLDADEPEDDAE